MIIEEKNERLLQKANEIVDKYMNYEERVQLGIAKERTAKKIVIKDSNQFQTVLENYPDLKANEGMRELLTQIREGENAYMFQKMRYNTVVEQHNFLIHSFPGCFLTLIFKLKDAEFYGRSNEVNKYSNDEFDMIGD